MAGAVRATEQRAHVAFDECSPRSDDDDPKHSRAHTRYPGSGVHQPGRRSSLG